MKGGVIHPITSIFDALPDDSSKNTNFTDYNSETPVVLTKCEKCGLLVNSDSLEDHIKTHQETPEEKSKDRIMEFPSESPFFSLGDEATNCSCAMRREYVISKFIKE